MCCKVNYRFKRVIISNERIAHIKRDGARKDGATGFRFSCKSVLTICTYCRRPMTVLTAMLYYYHHLRST